MNQELTKWKQFWNNMADKGDALDVINRNEEYNEKDVDYVVKKLDLNKNDVVLDLCCGNGIITNRIARYCKYIYGVDLSEKLISEAKTGAEESGKNISYFISDALNIPLGDDSVDKIFCLTSFHYFPNYDYADEVVKEMLRVLKPNGSILITDIPNKKNIWYFVWKLIRNNRDSQKIELISFQPTTSPGKKFLMRLKLLFRKFTNKKVESDDWLWYIPDLFQKFKTQGESVIIEKSIQKNKFLNYRIDVVIINKQ